jgi:hypothetical protein
MRAWIPPSIIEWAGSIIYLPRSTLWRASSYKSSSILGSLFRLKMIKNKNISFSYTENGQIENFNKIFSNNLKMQFEI